MSALREWAAASGGGAHKAVKVGLAHLAVQGGRSVCPGAESWVSARSTHCLYHPHCPAASAGQLAGQVEDSAAGAPGPVAASSIAAAAGSVSRCSMLCSSECQLPPIASCSPASPAVAQHVTLGQAVGPCCLPQMVAMSALLLLRNADHLLGDEPQREFSSSHSALA